MEIRSITFFVDPSRPLEALALAAADARSAFAEIGRAPQTVRLATTPFPDWLKTPGQLMELVTWCRDSRIDYLALGPVRLNDDRAYLNQLVTLLAAHEMVFASAEVADTDSRIDTGRTAEIAALIRELAMLRPDGFGNLFFAATANCPPGSPFFPVAYRGKAGGPVSFAIATEAADLAVDVIRSAPDLATARARLVSAIEREAATLVTVASGLASRHGFDFGGIDFSLAPFPEEARSVGAALEAMGIPAVGGHGTLFAAALVAECIDRSRFPSCGFSGLMLPVLEDVTLARRAAEGILTLGDLLLYSAVCGTGLDVVPLPGDVAQEELTGILLDVAALAVRLDKPLTARLMPLPGLAAGDPVDFDFSYFAGSGVMETKRVGATGLLSGRDRVVLSPR